MSNQAALELQRVGVTIHHRSLLQNISWQVETGQVAALLGPNGAGKTTLLRVITGYQFPTTGTAHLLGEEIGKTDVDALRRRVGLVDPSIPYFDGQRLSALDVVLSGFFGHLCLDFDHPSPDQRERGMQTLDDVGLGGKESRVFSTMSTGEQRRCLLARALVSDPELLILDEPTSGLDIAARQFTLDALVSLRAQRPSMSILFVTHHLEELIPATNNVLLLSRGQVAFAGHPSESLRSDRLSAAFGVPLEVRQDQQGWTWRVRSES